MGSYDIVTFGGRSESQQRIQRVVVKKILWILRCAQNDSVKLCHLHLNKELDSLRGSK